ncbi:hypothetical protein ACOSP7_032781 [Xanthoceras sorbifolium]
MQLIKSFGSLFNSNQFWPTRILNIIGLEYGSSSQPPGRILRRYVSPNSRTVGTEPREVHNSLSQERILGKVHGSQPPGRILRRYVSPNLWTNPRGGTSESSISINQYQRSTAQ